jgi:hypothetical protein
MAQCCLSVAVGMLQASSTEAIDIDEVLGLLSQGLKMAKGDPLL